MKEEATKCETDHHGGKKIIKSNNLLVERFEYDDGTFNARLWNINGNAEKERVINEVEDSIKNLIDNCSSVIANAENPEQWYSAAMFALRSAFSREKPREHEWALPGEEDIKALKELVNPTIEELIKIYPACRIHKTIEEGPGAGGVYYMLKPRTLALYGEFGNDNESHLRLSRIVDGDEKTGYFTIWQKDTYAEGE